MAIPKVKNGYSNALAPQDAPIHSWYRFVLSFPPHLVSKYLNQFSVCDSMTVLDPFCGTGTTLVECKKQGIASVGTEAHPMPLLASRVKTNWSLNPTRLRTHLRKILSVCERNNPWMFSADETEDFLQLNEEESEYGDGVGLTEDEARILPKGFISPAPLRKLLALKRAVASSISDRSSDSRDFFLLALATVLVTGAGNFSFGPEIYRTKPKQDYDVLGHFARQAEGMIQDLAAAKKNWPDAPASRVYQDNARVLEQVNGPIHAVITSPPYPNEKDYTRTTRAESILLGMIGNRQELRSVKDRLLRSNTRNVFVSDADSDFVSEFPCVQKVCHEIEKRRVELRKTSGFERLYHKVVAHYFGGMRRHFRQLKSRLAPGAKCAYVVGDQMSFLMVPVKTAAILAEIAEAEGYRVLGRDLWRERIGTKVKNSKTPMTTVRIREEVLLLENV